MNKFLTSLLVFLCLQLSVRAWNAEGHMLVAQIAYNHLNPAAKARCDALIATSVQYASSINNTFATAACWADDIKSSTSAYSTWHYIDLPFSLDGTATSGIVPAAFDVVQAVNLCVTNLQNPGLTPSNQAVNLRFLLHFVGDIQQPLHCSTAVSATRTTGDAGGNTFYITSDYWSNLHSLWDAGGGFLFDSLSRPLSAPSQNTLNAKAALIEADYPYNYNTNPDAITNSMIWAQESFNVAKTVCYAGLTQNATISTGYLDTAMATTEQRMAQGGHRLADLLNALFPPLTLTAITRTNGNFSFSWNTISNSTYKVQWKQQLSDPTWNDLTNITATTSSASFKEKFSPAQRFYRVTQ
jgi:hypothetical protein